MTVAELLYGHPVDLQLVSAHKACLLERVRELHD